MGKVIFRQVHLGEEGIWVRVISVLGHLGKGHFRARSIKGHGHSGPGASLGEVIFRRRHLGEASWAMVTSGPGASWVRVFGEKGIIG